MYPDKIHDRRWSFAGPPPIWHLIFYGPSLIAKVLFNIIRKQQSNLNLPTVLETNRSDAVCKGWGHTGKWDWQVIVLKKSRPFSLEEKCRGFDRSTLPMREVTMTRLTARQLRNLFLLHWSPAAAVAIVRHTHLFFPRILVLTWGIDAIRFID